LCEQELSSNLICIKLSADASDDNVRHIAAVARSGILLRGVMEKQKSKKLEG